MLWANEIYVMFQEADRRFQIQYILSRTKDMGKKACAVKKVAQTIGQVCMEQTTNTTSRRSWSK